MNPITPSAVAFRHEQAASLGLYSNRVHYGWREVQGLPGRWGRHWMDPVQSSRATVKESPKSQLQHCQQGRRRPTWMSIWPHHVQLCPLSAKSPSISVAPDRRYGGSYEPLDFFNVRWTRAARRHQQGGERLRSTGTRVPARPSRDRNTLITGSFGR